MIVALDDAKRLAEKLRQNPRILGVDLFGSVARKGSGHDLDLILLTGETTASAWWKETGMRIRPRTFWTFVYHKAKKFFPFLEKRFDEPHKIRGLEAAGRILGIDLSRLASETVPGMKIDVILLPEKWREEKSLNVPVVARLPGLSDDTGTLAFLERNAINTVRL